MEKKLEVKNLVISFRTQNGYLRAVRNISFDLYKGETLAIVGESGSGKSVTSKAIIGILANNSIVEGGEILYDGQDLLKIQEEDFHKIRGDKIAMIFQDPLSSLNPIMRVGNQLTEAMILNGKARQKNAKKDFNFRLKLINTLLDEIHPENKARNKERCDTFNSFCIESTKLELAYNNANNAAIALSTDIENLLFLIEKNAPADYIKEFKEIKRELPKTYHEHVVHSDAKLEELYSTLDTLIKQGKKFDHELATTTLKDINAYLKEGGERKVPNFFRLGYYMLCNKDYQPDFSDIDKLDEMTLKYLMDNFMSEFLLDVGEALVYSRKKSIASMKELIKSKEELLGFFASDDIDLKKSEKMVKDFAKAVTAGIDRLSIHKYSSEFAFEATIKNNIKVYFSGIENNPKMMKKHDNMQAKYDSLVEKGKKPTWKVIPPLITDLELAKHNIIKTLEELFAYFEATIASEDTYDTPKMAVEMIDHFKEMASRVVYTVTPELAKAKALDLMEEVGIPEPAIRFRQYPFEFSGGMRQRIVIAIALSANPDILICDEPTTALDVTIQAQILELINKIKKERNLSVIFITHNLGVVANMADRIGVMYAGKIVEYGTAEDVFYDPRHPYTWALLASMPDLETKEKLDAIPGTPPNMIYPPVGDAFAERNKYALEIDFEMQPPMFEVSPTHYAATWLLHPSAPKVEPPKIIADRIKRMKEAMDNE